MERIRIGRELHQQERAQPRTEIDPEIARDESAAIEPLGHDTPATGERALVTPEKTAIFSKNVPENENGAILQPEQHHSTSVLDSPFSESQIKEYKSKLEKYTRPGKTESVPDLVEDIKSIQKQINLYQTEFLSHDKEYRRRSAQYWSLKKFQSRRDILLDTIPFSRTLIPTRRRYRRALEKSRVEALKQKETLDYISSKKSGLEEVVDYRVNDLFMSTRAFLLENDSVTTELDRQREFAHELSDRYPFFKTPLLRLSV
jgi:hypothetical protein